jgi:hypothetical protein
MHGQEKKEQYIYQAFNKAKALIESSQLGHDIKFEQLALLKQMALLVPIEFLDARLNNSTVIPLFERWVGMDEKAYLAERKQDVWAMIGRINDWYASKLEITDCAELVELKKYFDQLAAEYGYEKPELVSQADLVPTPVQASDVNVLMKAQESRGAYAQITAAALAAPMAVEMDRGSSSGRRASLSTIYSGPTAGEAELPARAAVTSGWFDGCGTASVCCIDFCGRTVEGVGRRHAEADGIEMQQAGGEYSGGFWGCCDGTASGYFGAEWNDWLHNAGTNICGEPFANTCCIGAAQSDGAVAARAGEGVPDNVAAAMAYHETNCNDAIYSAMVGCPSSAMHFCDTTLPGAISGGVGVLCDAETWSCLTDAVRGCGGQFEMLLAGCRDIGDLCERIPELAQACCQCMGSCNCGDMKELYAILAATAGGIWLGLTDAGEEEGGRRLLQAAQTSAEFTPSIVLMVLAVLTLGPSVAANFFQAVKNIQDGVAVDQSKRRLYAQMAGATTAVAMSVVGGASGWTYVTALMSCMSMAHFCVDRQNRKANGALPSGCGLALDGDLPAWAYLSRKEWRAVASALVEPDLERLQGLLDQLSGSVRAFKLEAYAVSQTNCAMKYLVNICWTGAIYARARSNISDDIKAAHELPAAKARLIVPQRVPEDAIAVRASMVHV